MSTPKNMVIAVLLAFLFGPLGLLYASVKGGLIMLAVSLVIAVLTLGLGLLILIPANIIWAVLAVQAHNKALEAKG